MFAFLDWPETKKLAAAFDEARVPLRFVGGAVRDSILKLQVHEVDAATPALPERVIQILESAGIRAIPTGIAHGTVTAVVNGKSFEITTLRKDVATDGRHAQVQYVDDWKEDAARRDFTMNAMYVSPQGELTDYFGGADDAEKGVVKFIGDATKRIGEDYLRILRLFRFYAWYGKKDLDKTTLDVCKAAAAHIDRLSGERVQKEMMKLLAAPKPFAAMESMPANVLRHVFGFKANTVGWLDELQKAEAEIGLAPSALRRLAVLVPSVSIAGHLAAKWRLSNADAGMLDLLLQTLPKLQREMSAAEQKQWIRKLGNSAFIDAVTICSAQDACYAGRWNDMAKLAQQWQATQFPISGNDLLAAGIPAGKEMGVLLKKLENAWEASDYTLSKKQLLAGIKK